jgi:hypothetical protein
MEKDKDKIVSYDSTTNFYINGRGEALKFTKGSTSIYSTTPNKPHDGTHIKYKAETKKLQSQHIKMVKELLLKQGIAI